MRKLIYHQEEKRRITANQVGVGVSGGCEAAVYAIRRLVEQMPDDHVLVKLDFFNAFNTVGRDTILNSIANKTQELYRFVHAF